MLVTHVDYDATAFSLSSNSVNNTIGHSRYTIIPADGIYISSYDTSKTTEEYKKSMEGDPYPSFGITELCSIPWYTGDDTKKPILNIKEDESAPVEKLTFDYIVPHDTITPREGFVFENIFVNGAPEGNITMTNAAITSYSNGDKVIEATDFNNAEIQFADQFNANGKDSLHIDIFAYENMQVKIGFTEKSGKNGMKSEGLKKESGTQMFDLKEKTWTRIDVSVEKLANGGIAIEDIGGITLSNGNGKTIYINNIYFFTQKVNAIDEIQNNADIDEKIYTPEGIRINTDKRNLKKGLYIINGKKYMIK